MDNPEHKDEHTVLPQYDGVMPENFMMSPFSVMYIDPYDSGQLATDTMSRVYKVDSNVPDQST